MALRFDGQTSALPLTKPEVLQLAKKLESLGRLARHVAASDVLNDHGTGNYYIQQVKGNEQAQAALAMLSNAAKTSAYAYLPYLPSQEQLESALPADIALIERGIECRVIYSPVAEQDENVLDFIEHSKTANSTRVCAQYTPPIRLSLFDNNIAYIRAVEHEEIVITDIPQIVMVAGSLFELLWSSSIPFVLSGEEYTPTAKELTVIHLLASGKTLTSIATQLGVAPRTIDRILQSLEDRVGAASRFDLALKIQELGWLNAK